MFQAVRNAWLSLHKKRVEPLVAWMTKKVRENCDVEDDEVEDFMTEKAKNKRTDDLMMLEGMGEIIAELEAAKEQAAVEKRVAMDRLRAEKAAAAEEQLAVEERLAAKEVPKAVLEVEEVRNYP